MADVKISALPAASALAGTEVGPIVQTATTVKTTVLSIAQTLLPTANTFTAAQTINLNSGSAPTPATGTILQLVGTDATLARTEIDSFGAIGAYTVRRANGTAASPTALASSDQIGSFNWHGYYVTGGPGYSNVTASMTAYANQNWTSTAQGTRVAIRTTADGGTTMADAAVFGADGSLTVTAGVTATNGTFSGNVQAGSASQIRFSTTTIMTAPSAAVLQLGAASAASPVAQKLTVQSVVTGTSNIAGAAFTIAGSQGTGTGVGGSIVFQTAPAGSTGSTPNALATVGTLNSAGLFTAGPAGGANFAGFLTESGLSVGTGATGAGVSIAQINLYLSGTNVTSINSGGVNLGVSQNITFGSTSTASSSDTYMGRRAAANIRHGQADAASPIAQTISVQGVVAGTSNTAGVNLTFDGSQGTGTGNGGSIIFRTAAAGSTGSTQNALVTALTIAGDGTLTAAGLVNANSSVNVVGRLAISNAGAAPLLMNGALFTGGSGSTTFPQYFSQPTGTTAVTTWSTAGTVWGTNLTAGFTGNFFDFRIGGGTSLFAVASTGTVTLADAANLVVGSSTGTKVATATTQKLGFWNATPLVQQTTASAAATFAANTSLIANDTATFDNYTIGQVVKILRNLGILA